MEKEENISLSSSSPHLSTCSPPAIVPKLNAPSNAENFTAVGVELLTNIASFHSFGKEVDRIWNQAKTSGVIETLQFTQLWLPPRQECFKGWKRN